MLSYAVDGVPVTKNAIRQTLVNEDYSGHFAGGFHETDTACANSALNGTTESIGVLNIVQSGAAITVTSLPSTGGSCAYAGMLTQYGQMGDVVGSFSCSNGSRGTFHDRTRRWFAGVRYWTPTVDALQPPAATALPLTTTTRTRRLIRAQIPST